MLTFLQEHKEQVDLKECVNACRVLFFWLMMMRWFLSISDLEQDINTYESVYKSEWAKNEVVFKVGMSFL